MFQIVARTASTTGAGARNYQIAGAAIDVAVAVARDSECSGPRKSFFNNSLMTYSFSLSGEETTLLFCELFKTAVLGEV